METKRTIFNIADDILALEDLLERTGGDVSDPEAEAQIDAFMRTLAEDKERKIDNYCALIKFREATAKARKEEAARLARLATTDERTVERLKSLLKWFMETTNDPKIETPRFKVRIQRNGGRPPLNVSVSFDALPERFREEVTTYKLREDELRAALAEGDEDAAGVASIGETGTHIRIA